MSNSDPPPPKPNGSEFEPESGSFSGLSRSGSSPWEKPKGRSDIPQRYSPVDRRAGPRVTLSVNLGRFAHGPRRANLYCGRREQADFDAAGRLGADPGVRAAAVDGHGAVCVA